MDDQERLRRKPDVTDPTAYFAHNQGYAWADPFAWAPSVPYWYTAITIFLWDRDLGFRERTMTYWVIIWGIWPVFGVLSGIHCLVRLLE